MWGVSDTPVPASSPPGCVNFGVKLSRLLGVSQGACHPVLGNVAVTRHRGSRPHSDVVIKKILQV